MQRRKLSVHEEDERGTMNEDNGKWIIKKDPNGATSWDWQKYICPECGNWQTYGPTNYCPNCGAKMKGDDKEKKEFGKWLPIVSREMTEDEAKHYFNYLGYRIDEAYTILDCYLPEDGQEVLITVNGYVTTDTFVRDEGYGCYFEGYDIEDVTAWQPLPEPYKKGDTE